MIIPVAPPTPCALSLRPNGRICAGQKKRRHDRQMRLPSSRSIPSAHPDILIASHNRFSNASQETYTSTKKLECDSIVVWPIIFYERVCPRRTECDRARTRSMELLYALAEWYTLVCTIHRHRRSSFWCGRDHTLGDVMTYHEHIVHAYREYNSIYRGIYSPSRWDAANKCADRRWKKMRNLPYPYVHICSESNSAQWSRLKCPSS